MRAKAILQRLIWKETRENMLMASTGFIAPAIILSLIKTKIKLLDWAFLVLVLVTVMGTFMWTAGKANAKRGRNDFEDGYLVLPKSLDWLASYLAPALVSFAIGAWLGYALSCFPHWSESHWNHTQLWTALSSGLYMLAGFLVSYAASSAFGFIAGIIIGAVWLMFPGVPLIAHQAHKVVDESAIFVGLMARTAAGAAVGSLLVMAGSCLRIRLKLLSVTPLAVAILFCFVPIIPNPAKLFPGLESRYLTYATVSKSSSDGSVVVSPTGRNAGMSASLRLVNFSTGAVWSRAFHQAVQPVALTNRVAYLAQQSIGKEHVKMLAWDVTTGKVRCVVKMPASKNAILRCQPGTASPDGQLIIFQLSAPVGPGQDLWALDTKTGRCRLLIPGMTSQCPPVQWTNSHALLPFRDKVIRICLADLSRREIDIPISPEVQR